MALRLIIEDDEGSTTIVALGQNAVTIGRQAGNTIQLTEQNVSRQHARMYPQSDGWVVEDLQSYNGIRVNGVPIEGRVLVHQGDLVQIGDYHLALSDDVDKETLNLDRTEAANDDEPLLASSSAHLPKLVPDEGAAAPAAAPAAASAAAAPAPSAGSKSAAGVVGGPQPIVEEAGPEPFTVERRKGSSGLVLGLIGAGVVVLGLGAFLMLGGDEEQPAANTGPQPEPVEAGPPGAPPPQPVAAPAPAPAPAPAQVDPAAAPQQPVAPAPEGEVQEEAAPSEQAPTGSRKRKRGKRRRSSGKSSSEPAAAPPPPPPPEPGANPDDLLKEARKASLTGNATQAYKLAKQAYSIKKSQAALEVMGVAACKMGDAGKAKSAYKKLSGKKKDNLAKVCSSKGITLE